MSSSADLIAAATDPDLRARLVATLAAQGHATPAATVDTRIGAIVAQSVTPEGLTIADVLASARVAYVPTPRPGENLAAVTDDHLRAALAAIAV